VCLGGLSGNRYLYPGTGVTFRFDGEGGLALGKSVNVCLGAQCFHALQDHWYGESHSALTAGARLSRSCSITSWGRRLTAAQSDYVFSGLGKLSDKLSQLEFQPNDHEDESEGTEEEV
jgi:hypothetical protein